MGHVDSLSPNIVATKRSGGLFQNILLQYIINSYFRKIVEVTSPIPFYQVSFCEQGSSET